jgi:hypothetical protein
MKKTALLFALAAAFITTSCSKEYTINVAYSLAITTWDGSYSDLQKVENYLESIQLPGKSHYVSRTGKGKSEKAAIENADKQIKKDSEEWIARFKSADIEALDLDENTHFIWTVSRLIDASDPSSESLIINQFKWNIPN